MRYTILLTYFAYCTEANENLLRVFGGRDAIDGEFPYVVQLVREKSLQPFCTAAVLTTTWTLTAGHCVHFSNQKFILYETVMIAYKPSIKSETAYSKILSIKVHPAYNAYMNNGLNDIAMVNTQPALLTQYGKLSPVGYNTLYGQKVTLVGYGAVNVTGFSVPILQVLDVIARECQTDGEFDYPKICFAPLCSSPSDVLQSLCHGDSGGPAIHASGVIAVASKLEKIRNTCDPIEKKQRRQVVTRFTIALSAPTSAFIDWISSLIKTKVS